MSFHLASLNVGSLRGGSGEVAEILEQRNIDLCCVQEIRWRGRSTRIMEEKRVKYKLFCKGNDDGK